MDKLIKMINQWLKSSNAEKLKDIKDLYHICNVAGIIYAIILVSFLIFMIFSEKNKNKVNKNLLSVSEYDCLLTQRETNFDILNQCIQHYRNLNKKFNQELIIQIVAQIILVLLVIFIFLYELYTLMCVSLYSLNVCMIILFIFVILDGVSLLYFKSIDNKGKKYNNNVLTLQNKISQSSSYIYDMQLKMSHMKCDKGNTGIIKIIFYPNGNESEFYRDVNGTIRIKQKNKKYD